MAYHSLRNIVCKYYLVCALSERNIERINELFMSRAVSYTI